jgi:hypothetical protein
MSIVLLEQNGSGVSFSNFKEGIMYCDNNSVMQSGKVDAYYLIDVSITNDKIVDGAIINSKLYNGAVTLSKISNNAVNSDKIIDGAVISSKIIDGAVTLSKISNDAVNSDKIVDGSVTTAKLDNGAVTLSKISNDAVNSDKIVDGAVILSKLSNNAVNSDKIVDGAVTNNKLSGSISDSKLEQITSSGKVANSATSATSDNINDTIVKRNEFGNFTANTIYTQNINIDGAIHTSLAVGSVSVDGLGNLVSSVLTFPESNASNVGNTLVLRTWNGEINAQHANFATMTSENSIRTADINMRTIARNSIVFSDSGGWLYGVSQLSNNFTSATSSNTNDTIVSRDNRGECHLQVNGINQGICSEIYTGDIDLSISSTLPQYILVSQSVASSLVLPTASALFAGGSITFRRVGGTISDMSYTTSDLVPNGNLTVITDYQFLDGVTSSTITCLKTGVSTYAWMMV